jgi:hypothetical protein
MKYVICICLFFFLSVGLAIAGATSALPFKDFVATVDVGKPYEIVTIRIECSSIKDDFDRKFTKIIIETKDKQYIAPEAVISKFRNPGTPWVHGGIEGGEVNLIFDYEVKPGSYTNGNIRFHNGVFSVW